MEKTTVGVVVPTGYSFNLDGTAIYLTMASIFIADAMGDPLSVGEQIGLLAFMIIASKGGGRRQRCRTGHPRWRTPGTSPPEMLDGVGVIVGIDRFMSEARAVTNFSGNAVATLLVGSWTHTMDKHQIDEVLSGGRAPVRRDQHGRRRTRPRRDRCRRQGARGNRDAAVSRFRPARDRRGPDFSPGSMA